MDNKLSKPAGQFTFEPLAERWHHIKHGEKQNLEGGPWDLKKLYSQEYVSALDKVAQFWIGESAGWKQRAEDAEKRIAELELDELAMRASSRAVHEAQENHINQQQDRIDSLEKTNAGLGRGLAAAEQKLATPVRLPTEHELHQVACSECAGNCLELVESTVRAAGFTVEGDE